jgi:outer membrane protein assembly factor BamB
VKRKILSALAGIALLAPAPGLADHWPMFMAGPAHRGQADPAATAPLRNLRLAWRFDVHAAVSATPVAAGQQLFVGAENGNLYAIDLQSHRLQWLFHARGGIASTPAVAHGLVVFLARDGSLHALDAASGAIAWTFRTQGEAQFAAHGMFGQPLEPEPVPDPWDLYLSSPLVHDGKVYVGSSDQRVYALDLRSGKLAWVFKTGGMVHSSPALAGANIVVGSWDGALYALDAASGVEKWRYQTQGEQKNSIMFGIQASPSVDHDTVYIGSRDGYLYALDAASGKRKWRYDARGSWVVGTAAIDEENVYVGTSDSGLLLALDKRSGAEKYRYPTKVWTFASPIRVGDAMIGASMKGELVGLDAASGALRWRYLTDAGRADAFHLLDAGGAFDNARLYGKGANQLQAAVEHVKRLGAFAASPVWHQGQLIAVDANGEVLVFAADKP